MPDSLSDSASTSTWAFLRHGYAQINYLHDQYLRGVDLFTPGILQTADKDYPLEKQGIQQANQIRPWIVQNLPHNFVGVTSFFKRAEQTYQAIFNRKPDVICDAFNERDWGIFMHTHPHSNKEERLEFNAKDKVCIDLKAPGGESTEEVDIRIRDGIDLLDAFYPHQNMIIVSHGHALLNAMMKMEGIALTEESWQHFQQNRNELKNCGLYLCEVRNEIGPIEERLVRWSVLDLCAQPKEIVWHTPSG